MYPKFLPLDSFAYILENAAAAVAAEQSKENPGGPKISSFLLSILDSICSSSKAANGAFFILLACASLARVFVS